MQNKNNLQDKFKDFGAQPTDALWDSIASNLDHKKKKKAIWFWWFGAVASIVLLIGTGLYFNEHNTKFVVSSHKEIIENEIVKTKVHSTENKNGSVVKTGKPESILELPNQPRVQPKTTDKKLTKKQNSSTIIKANYEYSTENTLADTEPKQAAQTNNTHQELSCANCNLIIAPRPLEALVISPIKNLLRNKITSPKQSRQFEYSFSTLTFFNLNAKQQNYNSPTTVSTNTSQATSVADEFSVNEALNFNSPLKTTIPLVLRFGVATKLSTRFKLQSGLDLGWIRTTPPKSNDIYQSSSNFTLGIPVFINLNIINKRRFDFNTNFGAINDFALLRQDKTYAYQTLQTNKIKITKGFLGAIETGVRFDYKLNETLKIGIGTSVRWYYYQNYPSLTNQNKNNTFYNLNLGLTWKY